MSLGKFSEILEVESGTAEIDVPGHGRVFLQLCPDDLCVERQLIAVSLGIGDSQLLEFAAQILDNADLPKSIAFFAHESDHIVIVKYEGLIRLILRTLGIRKNGENLEYNPEYAERAEQADFVIFENDGVEQIAIPINILRKTDFIVKEADCSKPKVSAKCTGEVQNEEPEISEPDRPRDDFVHLHVHSQYSLLDGVPHPTEIVERIYEMGQPAVALTDHGYMHGLYKFQQACDDYGIKPIHGFEAYLVDDMTIRERVLTYHLVLLAMNETGWKNLIALNTLAGRDGFYYRPRMDFALLSKYTEGVIALSACYKSPVSYHFSVEGRNPDMARDNMRKLKSLFGDRFYNEVQQTGWDEYDNLVPEIIQLGEEENVKTVVTNDAHYARNGDHEVQSTMTKITTGGGLEFSCTGLYLKSREEMIQGPITPQMADVTLEIADRVDFQVKFDGYRFPAFDISESEDYQEFMNEINERSVK